MVVNWGSEEAGETQTDPNLGRGEGGGGRASVRGRKGYGDSSVEIFPQEKRRGG